MIEDGIRQLWFKIAVPNRKVQMYMSVNNCVRVYIVGFVFILSLSLHTHTQFHFLSCYNINSVLGKEDIWVNVTVTHSVIHD